MNIGSGGAVWFRGSHGTPETLHLGSELARGGEGTAFKTSYWYSDERNPDCLVKIYNPAKLSAQSERLIQKILFQVARFNELTAIQLAGTGLTKFVAWPRMAV